MYLFILHWWDIKLWSVLLPSLYRLWVVRAEEHNSSHFLALHHIGPPPHVDFHVENLCLEHRFLPEFSEYSALHKAEKKNMHMLVYNVNCYCLKSNKQLKWNKLQRSDKTYTQSRCNIREAWDLLLVNFNDDRAKAKHGIAITTVWLSLTNRG